MLTLTRGIRGYIFFEGLLLHSVYACLVHKRTFKAANLQVTSRTQLCIVLSKLNNLASNGAVPFAATAADASRLPH